jgi:hypothetical protein
VQIGQIHPLNVSEREKNETSSFIRKKFCDRLKKEWLSELIDTEILSSVHTQHIKLSEIVTYQETKDDVICSFCSKANVRGEFSTGIKWKEWKLNCLKRHLNQNMHLDSVLKLQNLNKGGILRMLSETPGDREMRVELAERRKTNINMVKVLINVVLAIKMSASVLSVQDIHDVCNNSCELANKN